MKKGILTALLIALVLIAAGAAMLALSYKKGGWNFMKKEKANRTVEISEAFDSIYVDGESCGVQLLPSEDGKCTVYVEESDNLNFTVEVKNGVLEIVQHDSAKWYERILNFDFTGYKAVVRLPEGIYASIELKTVSGSIASAADLECTDFKVDSTSGSVDVANISCSSANCSCISGSLKAANINCGSALFHATSGSVKLEDVIADSKLEVSVTSGSIRFDRIDSAEILLHTISGSIKGSVLSPKHFETHTVSGSVNVPNNGEGGFLKAETTSGSITITVEK